MTDEPKVKRAKKEKPAKKVHAAGSLEAFTVEKIHRRELKAAPYNPRTMSDDERAALRLGIETNGLVAPQTWNRRTGNLVGGHQRTAALDDCYGTDDYELTVAVIDVDEVKEKELNLLLNNGAAQGDWDMGKLEAIFKDTPTIELAGTGFNAADLFQVFGASPFEARADDALSEVAQRIRDARTRQAETKAKVKSREEVDFYFVVVFKDNADRESFATAVGWQENRYQDGRQLRIMCADHIARQAARLAALTAPAADDQGRDADDGTGES